MIRAVQPVKPEPEIASFAEKLAILHRYSRSIKRESLHLASPGPGIEGEPRWHLRLRFDGELHAFQLDAAEVAVLRRDAAIAFHLKDLFTP
jgi:hypothetical protein